MDHAKIKTDLYGLQMLPPKLEKEKLERKQEITALDHRLSEVLDILKTIKLVDFVRDPKDREMTVKLVD